LAKAGRPFSVMQPRKAAFKYGFNIMEISNTGNG
jgi:hypothetical protein